MTVAYDYKWTELATGKWYVGARGKRGCKGTFQQHIVNNQEKDV